MELKIIDELIGGMPSWTEEANCKGADADLFFPERGASTRKAKAKVKVKGNPITESEHHHVINLLKLLVNENINIKNISYKRNKLNNIVATYLKENTIKNTNKVINGVLQRLQKKK